MKKNYFFNNIFSISILLFIIKYFFFFYTNIEINFITKLIFEVKDWQYFTLIFNLSNLDFNPSYNPGLSDLRFLPLPVYSIFFHSLFIKFFNVYGFIISELFIILLFFYIISNFFKKLGIDETQAIFLTLFIFCTPELIEYLDLDRIKYVGAIKELYNLRIPRPSISNLYLFSFFLLLISNEAKTQFKYKQLALIGLFFALMWGSFYYNLVISGITFIIYYFYITFKSDQKFPKYIKDVFFVLLFCIFFSIPIVLILSNSEPDYLVRVGLLELDIYKKKILLNHFIERILSIKFIIIFILITALYFYLKSRKVYKIEGINLLYFLFFGSFLAPLIFIIISPTISEIYHFPNMLIALSFFIILIFSFLIISPIITKLPWHISLFKSLIIFLLFLYLSINYSLTQKNFLHTEKVNFNQLIDEFKNINLDKDNQILTFDGRFQTYLILNKYNNLLNVLGVFTSLTDEMIENQLISIFKFLKLNEIDFNNFIKNEKQGWRFINNNVAETFYLKYQANTLTTYKNSMDFSKQELKNIKISSPLHNQQLIIPVFEIKRLMDKFKYFNENKKLNPNLIIINSNDNFTKELIIDEKLYCSKTINETYTIYISKMINSNC